jgi:TonB-linked SusC/RagA family outer membrane protein
MKTKFFKTIKFPLLGRGLGGGFLCLLLLCLPLLLSAQTTIKVNGKVLANKTEPLEGATVAVKGTTNAVLADEQGNYFIEVSDRRAVLVFSFIGFATQEVTVGNQININVSLTEEANTLQEVVVSAFGSQRKVSVVGAITSVRPEVLQSGVSRSVSNNLAGQLAGVIGIQRSGQVGRDQADIWIRGMSTFVNADLVDRRTQSSFTKPLILVDGIERSMNDMDPAEIESFSILKDASATAMYGVRGANGVVLINTKRGVIGKPRISVRTEYAISAPTQFPEFLSAVPYMEESNKIYLDNGNSTPFYSQERIDRTRYGYDPELYPDTDWISLISKDIAQSSRTNISITGGSEVLRYALVASYLHEDGIFATDPNQEWDSSLRLNRFNIRSNVDVNITKTTLVRVNIGGHLQNCYTPGVMQDGIYYIVFRTPPIYPAVYNDGSIPVADNGSNPWALQTQTGWRRDFQSSVESLFSVEQDLKFLLPGLKVRASFSFDNYASGYQARTRNFTSYKPASARDDFGNLILGNPTAEGNPNLGKASEADFGHNTTYMEANLSYTNTFGEHYVDAMLLLNRREYNDSDPVPFRNQGMAGRLSYNYGRRYVAEVNFGYNGSENLAKKNRYGFFPSVAAGWVLSEEAFMAPLKETINMLKVRGSYGLVGNDQLTGRRFAYIATINDGASGYTFGRAGNTGFGGTQEGDFATPDLKWETVAKTNLGIDLGLLNSITLQADWFYERRSDIFMQRATATPAESGIINNIYANYGVVVNRGVELTLDFNKRFGADWEVLFRGTLTYAKNKVIERDEAAATLGTWRSWTGHPVGVYYGYVAERLYEDDDFNPDGTLKAGIPTVTLPVPEGAGASSVRPGDIKFKDMDGNGIIDQNDSGPLDDRTREPKLVYGFGGTVRYKDFDLTAFFQGIGDSYIIYGHRDMYFFPGGGKGIVGNMMSNAADRWTVDNPSQDVFYPRATWGMSRINTYDSTWWLKNVSYLRMRNIEIGYTVPQRLLAKINVKGARVFLGGNNLLTFTGFKFWDPEVGDQASDYPPMKTVQLGIDITF